MYAEAGVEPDDARTLAAMLTKYAEMADRDNAFDMNFNSGDCGSRDLR